MLSACTLSPNTPEPKLDVPESFRAGAGAPGAAWPSADWWRGFGAPELDALMGAAEAANLDIAAAAARVQQADAQVRVAGAALLPSLDATASYTRDHPSSGSGSGFSRAGGTTDIFNAALNASYEIDFWGKNRAALNAAKSSAIASRFDQETVALGIMSGVANTYFAILAAQDRLRIARDNLRIAEGILDALRGRLAVGTATALDIAQQESLVAVQRAAIPPLEQTLRQNVNALAILVGEAPERLTVRGGDIGAITVPEVTPGLPSELLARRPDVQSAEAQLAAANANVQVARAAFFPSIQLTTQGGFQSTALSSLFGTAAGFYTLASALTQPIFQGGALEGQLELSRGRYMELMQDYRKAVISAFSDVENALIASQQTTAQERLQREAVVTSRRAYQISEARLREGTVDITTVLTVEQTLFQAEDTLTQVRLARLQAVVGLYQALGGGWSRPKEPPTP